MKKNKIDRKKKNDKRIKGAEEKKKYLDKMKFTEKNEKKRKIRRTGEEFKKRIDQEEGKPLFVYVDPYIFYL